MPTRLAELHATAHSQPISEGYGTLYGAPRPRLVNPSKLRMTNSETESMLTEVLSGQLREFSEFKPRKEA